MDKFVWFTKYCKRIGSKNIVVALEQTTITLAKTSTAFNPYLFSVSASTNDIIFFEDVV